VQRSAIIGFLAAVLVGNLVLMLTQPRTTHALPDPADKRPDIERLTSHKVASNSDLTAAAAAAGLRLSRRFRGSVDALFRIDGGRVTMRGWVVDTDGDGTPLEVVVFVAGAAVASAATRGERPDVTEHIRLGLGAEKNIAFQVSFPCRTGDQPVVVGLGPKERYIPVRSPPCP
jgi:hypothetical protein